MTTSFDVLMQNNPTRDELPEIETGVSREVLATGVVAVADTATFDAGFYSADYGPAKHRSSSNDITPEDN